MCKSNCNLKKQKTICYIFSSINLIDLGKDIDDLINNFNETICYIEKCSYCNFKDINNESNFIKLSCCNGVLCKKCFEMEDDFNYVREDDYICGECKTECYNCGDYFIGDDMEYGENMELYCNCCIEDEREENVSD